MEAGRPALALRCLYRSHRRFAVELRGLVLQPGLDASVRLLDALQASVPGAPRAS